MKKTSAVCIIPARGGSKRIPRKNIKEFLGKPIIAYSIEAAVTSELFEEVIVSTDDGEIKTIAEKYGAKVPFIREAELADDYATTDDVLFSTLDKLKEQGREYKYMVCLYATAPFVTAQNLCQAMKKMEEDGKADQLLSVVEYSYPPQRSYRIAESGRAEYVYPEYVSTRSQDLEKWYHDAGQFYIFDASVFMMKRGVIVDNTIPYVLEEMQVQDIDTESDWKMAELKYTIIQKNPCDRE